MDSPQVQDRPHVSARGFGFSESIRVLLVDDDEDSYIITRSQLSQVEDANIDLEWASRFDAGLDAIRRGAHDAYLVDYRLGERDGLELMRQAKAEGCAAPIIILTGQDDHAIDLRAMREGAAYYLVKGQITGLFIERTVRYAVERRRAEDQRLRHEAQMQVLTEQMPAIVWTTDAQMRVTSAAGAGLRGLNLKPGDLVGQTLFQIFATGDENHPAIAAHRRTLRGESVFLEDEFRGRTYHSHSNPLRQSGGRIVGTVGVAIDVTTEKHVQQEMRAARLVQEAFLPKSVPLVPGYDLAGICHPAKAAGGDYYDYLRMPDGALGIVIADVSRHDFGSAMIMADACRLVRMLAKQHTDPGAILTAANLALAEDTNSDYFVTLFMARVDPGTRELTYAAAGHDGYVLDPEGTHRHLPSTSLPLGADESTVVPCGDIVVLEPGQSLFLFTDGFSETMAPDGEMFGTGRVLEHMKNHRGVSARGILDGLFGAVQDYCRPDTLGDDATAVLLKVDA